MTRTIPVDSRPKKRAVKKTVRQMAKQPTMKMKDFIRQMAKQPTMKMKDCIRARRLLALSSIWLQKQPQL